MRKPTAPWLSWLVPLSMAPFWIQCEAPPPANSAPTAITNRVASVPSELVFKVLQLKTKSLLDGVQLDEKRIPIIDAQRKAAILAEQDAAIATLRSLSDQVQIIYRYRFVLNGLAVVMPRTLADAESLPGVIRMEITHPMALPETQSSEEESGPVDFTTTSASFIGAHDVWKKLGITGKGIRVGVIDTGIDYTHLMLGGSGKVADYETAKGSGTPEAGQFPNAKVRGGVDLVGGNYSTRASDFTRHIPHPTTNPLDERGHGTHVAGTIAGIGDGVHTYNGVAPDADLFAIKVFGKDGGTEDAVVIAGLEYAVDPDGDLDPRDRLDVVNLSLGSAFGLPYDLYEEAVHNVTQAGITAVISAGNSGNVPYIVGSPGSSLDSISVAASVDGMRHNWAFPAVRFHSEDGSENFLVISLEGSITKPISEMGPVGGRLVPVGRLEDPLPSDLSTRLAGKIALVDRGVCTFIKKLQVAKDAGAIGVVMVNNQPGEPFGMGGESETPFPFPAIMVSQQIGEKLKASIASGKEMWIDFSTSDRIEEPARIDTLTYFSSRGPRTLDALIKPEISAPGLQILSAKMGGGDVGVKENGTSMAAPHMTGAVALLKQAHPDYTEGDVRAALLGTSRVVGQKGAPYSVAYQGTGRVQVLEAITTPVLVSPATWSVGEMAGPQRVGKVFRLHNTTSESLSLSVQMKSSGTSLRIEGPSEVTLAPKEVREVEFVAVSMGEKTGECSAWVEFRAAEMPVAHISILGIVKQLSHVYADTVEVGDKGEARIQVENTGGSDGEMLLFHDLGSNGRSMGIGPGNQIADLCSLQSAGYRVIQNQEGRRLLQVAVKLSRPVSSWEHCEISVQLAGTEKAEADWELLGTGLKNLVPTALFGDFQSAFTSAKLMHQIHVDYLAEEDKEEEDGKKEKGGLDYTPAILDHQPFIHYDFGTLGIVEVDIEKAKLPSQVWMKIAALTVHRHVLKADNFLGKRNAPWIGVSLDPAAQAFSAFPLKTVVPHNEKSFVSLHRGTGTGSLVAYFPFNKDENLAGKQDQQQTRLVEVAL